MECYTIEEVNILVNYASAFCVMFGFSAGVVSTWLWKQFDKPKQTLKFNDVNFAPCPERKKRRLNLSQEDKEELNTFKVNFDKNAEQKIKSDKTNSFEPPKTNLDFMNIVDQEERKKKNSKPPAANEESKVNLFTSKGGGYMNMNTTITNPSYSASEISRNFDFRNFDLY